jgi:hypothetical protein
MEHFRESHTKLTEGLRVMFAKVEQKYPEPENQGVLATLRAKVANYCDSPVPENDEQLLKLSQEHTLLKTTINQVGITLRRQKLWSN